MYKTLGANVSIVVSVLQIEEHHYSGAAQAHTNSQTKVPRWRKGQCGWPEQAVIVFVNEKCC